MARPAAGGNVQIVAWGDSLTRWARRYTTTVAQLKAWNNLKTDVIYLGQRLIVGP